MKISVITPTYNSASTIGMCIDSVAQQTFEDIEQIIVDGASSDNTLDIVKEKKGRVIHIISEPDNGMYSAMNKGISLASGDIIGILNSDDFFTSSDSLQQIADAFTSELVDVVYGDVRFVSPSDLTKTLRYYSSGGFHPGKFKFGFMPAHPSFYVRAKYYHKYGGYKEDYIIAADFELLVRFLFRYRLKSNYIKVPVVTMRTGGASTRSIRSNLIINKEIIRGCHENGINTNYFNVYSKYFIKGFQLLSNG